MHPNVYEPDEDSELLASVIRKLDLSGKTLLDMGCGSGILSLAAKGQGARVTAADINPDAVRMTSEQGINAIVSDQFSAIEGTFDVIVCNSPYLPEQKGEAQDGITTALVGGKHGYEWSVRFLEGAVDHLKPGGEIYLLFSSLSKPDKILDQFYYNYDLVAETSLFFEKLFVYRFRLLPVLQKLISDVNEVRFLAKGKHGVVYTGMKNGQKVAIKTLRGVTASHALLKEGLFLKKVNELGIGPKLMEVNDDYIIMDYIDGERIDHYFEHASEQEKKNVLIDVLKQCRKLDGAGIEKTEMTHPHKHILIGKKVVMIDFERCFYKEKPGNVTQFVQWIANEKLSIDNEALLASAKEYKTEMSDAAFDKIISYLA